MATLRPSELSSRSGPTSEAGGLETDGALRSISELLQTVTARGDVPGAAVALGVGERIEVLCAGVTCERHPLPITPHTIFQAASVSKTFTALATMCLVEAGVVDLDLPIRTWVPGFRLRMEEVAASLTLRHLLTHTSGMPGDFDVDTGRGEDALERLAPHWEQAVQWTRPGIYQYSNLHYSLIGHVLERASGRSFEELVGEYVIRPLGLRRTSYALEDLHRERLAIGHAADSDGTIVHPPWDRPRCRAAAGGVLTCLEDLMTFAQFHLNDGTPPEGSRLVRPETMAQMRTPYVWDTSDSAIGLCWCIRQWGRIGVVMHGGRVRGYLANVAMVPELDLAVVVLLNAATPTATELLSDVTYGALGSIPGFERPYPTPERRVPADQELIGTYDGQMSSLIIRRNAEGVLRLRSHAKTDARPLQSDDVPRRPIDPSEFEYGMGSTRARGAILRDSDGVITFLRIGRRLYRRATDEHLRDSPKGDR